ncbi:hypothetical protein [Hufsiella ginkgonis]|uniref:Uncharacterized protein n=1 Tax=Hufsiella ginkgonis TaxID=2695274 RepID=A0A7K1XRY1_9SPHI|nr:hypothetical protein [Hufsiella ginkgonis]MXV13745.1 hypothetical protein [Hufsiella ginkgonis]
MLLFLLLIVPVVTQRPHRPGDAIGSINWDIVGTVRFRQVSEKEFYPFTGKRSGASRATCWI